MKLEDLPSLTSEEVKSLESERDTARLRGKVVDIAEITHQVEDSWPKVCTAEPPRQIKRECGDNYILSSEVSFLAYVFGVEEYIDYNKVWYFGGDIGLHKDLPGRDNWPRGVKFIGFIPEGDSIRYTSLKPEGDSK